MSEIELVLNAIPEGKENAISRAQLAATVEMPDRSVRRCIEQARRNGEFILSDPERGGYYRSDDIGEIEQQYRIDKARALSVLARLKHMKRALKEAGRKV